jgi:signal transduction histidine kinase
LKRWGKNDPAQLDDSIEAILRETGNMNRIVTTLLEIARIENGKIKIEKNRFFLKDFFIGLRDEFKITYPELSFEIADENCLEIETDVQKLHQVFTVILANSIKFAGKNCTITLAARKSGDKIELSASDNGTGFSDAVLPHVFERFYKGDESHNRNEGGAGLGLSIARNLVLALGGSIEARNSPYGGAVLKILLPST